MKNRGFTLIELLIVIAIIAILALIAIPNFLEAQTRAKVSRAQSDMRTLGTAIEAYRTDYQFPPQAEQTNAPVGWYLTKSVNWFTKYRKLTTPTAYMATIPPDVFQEKDKMRLNAAGVLFFRELDYLNWQGDYKDPLCYLYETSQETRWRSYDSAGWAKPASFDMHMNEWSKANGNATWMVLSAGPDCDVFSGYRRPYPLTDPNPNDSDPAFNPADWPGAPTPDAESLQLVPWPLGCYDPSNGSISWGSLRRTDAPGYSN